MRNYCTSAVEGHRCCSGCSEAVCLHNGMTLWETVAVLCLLGHRQHTSLKKSCQN